MKKTYILMFVVGLVVLSKLGCSTSTRASKEDNLPASQQASTAVQPKELSEEDRQKYYRTFSTVSWQVDDKDTFMEARIETTKVLLQTLPEGFPFSRVIIKNLATKTTIYKQDLNLDFPLSMYTRNVNGDSYDELILVLSAGASANQLQILSVSATQVRELLAVQYRMDAALVDLSEGRVDVLVTPGFDRPFTTTRYVLKGERYEPVGTAPYDKLVNTVKRQFSAQRRSPLGHDR